MAMWQVLKWFDWDRGMTYLTAFISNDLHSWEIRSSHRRLDNYSSPLGYDAMSISKQLPTFRWSLSLLSSGCKKSKKRKFALFTSTGEKHTKQKMKALLLNFLMLSQKANLYFKWTGDILIFRHKRYTTWNFNMQVAAFSTTAVTICQRHADISHKAYTSNLTSETLHNSSSWKKVFKLPWNT